MNKFYSLLLFALVGICSLNAQVYFSENFDSGQGSWVFNNLNNDNYPFYILNASGIDPIFGSGSLVGFSFNNGNVITPNDLATSPQIDLTGVTTPNVVLEYQVFTFTDAPAEHYAVYITTSNDPSAIIASTPVLEETCTGGLLNRSVDLSSYVGQNVYLSFRHFNSTNQYAIIFDNIEIRSPYQNDIRVESLSLARYGLQGTDNVLSGSFKNRGSSAVSNFTFEWSDGTNTHSEVITASIAPNETATYEHPVPVNYADIVEKNIDISVTQVNGQMDSNTADNNGQKYFNTISQEVQKKVFIEEGTGTWCGYCPRGAIAMEYMYENHSDKFVGVAVHNGDPMQNDEYNSGSGFTGFPGMNVDRIYRDEGVSLETMESFALNNTVDPVPFKLDAYGSVVGNQIEVTAQVDFYSKFADVDYRLGVIVMEDDVTGTSSGYAQTNYYAGGGLGPMGGYENLPNPVPASQMVYDHVGRALLGGYDGQSGSVPLTSVNDGDQATYTFSYTVPDNYDMNNISVVVILINNANGEVLNANAVTADDLGTEDIQSQDLNFALYPNPVVDTVYLTLENGGKKQVTIYDMNGSVVLAQNVDFNNGTQEITVNNLNKGVYLISVAGEGASFTKQFIKK